MRLPWVKIKFSFFILIMIYKNISIWYNFIMNPISCEFVMGIRQHQLADTSIRADVLEGRLPFRRKM